MTDKKNNSSSSEDESVANALKEATDLNFFKNSMFDGKKTKRKHDKKHADKESERPTKCLKPSLRINPDREDNFHSFGVSQGYKDFVAKKLTEFLDRDIEIEDGTSNNRIKSSIQQDQNSGVKLLKTSNIFLTCDKDEILQNKPRKKRLENLEMQEDDIAKCKETAVDPEQILSKSETKAWNERSKGTVFKYKKMADGTLIEQ